MKKRPLKKSKKTGKKTAKKKNIKKSARPKKKSAPKKKKTASKKKSSKKASVAKPLFPLGKPVGVVTHYYTEISVAIVKFNKPISTGTKLHYRGATTDFAEHAQSMQFNHENVKKAPKGKQVGIKVKKRVREGDSVHIAAK